VTTGVGCLHSPSLPHSACNRALTSFPRSALSLLQRARQQQNDAVRPASPPISLPRRRQSMLLRVRVVQSHSACSCLARAAHKMKMPGASRRARVRVTRARMTFASMRKYSMPAWMRIAAGVERAYTSQAPATREQYTPGAIQSRRAKEASLGHSSPAARGEEWPWGPAPPKGRTKLCCEIFALSHNTAPTWRACL
jgi:hypothetical protein